MDSSVDILLSNMRQGDCETLKFLRNSTKAINLESELQSFQIRNVQIQLPFRRPNFNF